MKDIKERLIKEIIKEIHGIKYPRPHLIADALLSSGLVKEDLDEGKLTELLIKHPAIRPSSNVEHKTRMYNKVSKIICQKFGKPVIDEDLVYDCLDNAESSFEFGCNWRRICSKAITEAYNRGELT